MRPKLSIITPSLNQGQFIERTIRSVLDQGYEDLEYLIVDGGSSDSTVETIRRYEDRIAWWVSEPDAGQTDALNKGLARATGDVIAYINSDDYYLPGAFETAIGLLERSGASWMAGAARFVDANDRLTEVWRPRPPWTYEFTIKGRHWWALSPWSVPQPSAFWRRELQAEVGPFRSDLDYVFDTEFFLRLVYAGHYPELTDQELSVRVVHPEAKSANPADFRAEHAKLIPIFRPALTRSERVRLLLSRILLRVPSPRIRGRLFGALHRLRMAIAGERTREWHPNTLAAASTPRSRPRALAVNAVQGVLRRMGVELQPYIKGIPAQPREEDYRRVRLLASRGVDLVLDVGASIGYYALRTRGAGYRCRIVSFEPLRAAYAELSARAAGDPAWDCRDQALGSSAGPAELHVAGNSYSSSLLEIDDRHVESAPDSAYVGSETVSVVALDSIWDEVAGGAERPYLKLDVQGFELEALRGAERSLPKLVGVEAELSLVPLYEGAPLYREVIDQLEAAGFRLAGLEPEFFDPETAELLQVQGIFVRE